MSARPIELIRPKIGENFHMALIAPSTAQQITTLYQPYHIHVANGIYTLAYRYATKIEAFDTRMPVDWLPKSNFHYWFSSCLAALFPPNFQLFSNILRCLSWMKQRLPSKKIPSANKDNKLICTMPFRNARSRPTTATTGKK